MPIEHEFKFVLRSPDELYAKLLKMTNGVDGQATINQAYLSKGGRIRRLDWWQRDGATFYDHPSIAATEYVFTYKHNLSKHPGDLEFENSISQEDFELAWEDGDHKILKERFVLVERDHIGKWEVDFFKDSQGIYLAMAELEVPKGSGPPNRLHPIIQEYLRYAVPEEDDRFKNRKLCRRELVEQLLKEIA